MSEKERATGLHCVHSDCSGALSRIALTDTIDGGACGDGYRMEYFRCPVCERIHCRRDSDSWYELTKQEKQKNLYICEEVPKYASFCFGASG